MLEYCSSCKYWSVKDYNKLKNNDGWQNIWGICRNNKKTLVIETNFDFMCKHHKVGIKLKLTRLKYKIKRLFYKLKML